MSEPDIVKYCNLMEEVKRRISVIDFFFSRAAIPRPPTIESIGLQFRKIVELVAFGSLVANRDAYSVVYSGFTKDWNAGELLKKLERVNPDFYPKPIVELPSGKEGIKSRFVLRGPDYLSKQDFVEVYGRCGVLMHAANPFGSGIDYSYYEQKIPIWVAQVVNLLNSHEIRLINEPGLWLIHMKEERDDNVHNYIFKPLLPSGT
jgi:hypothetical protein